MSLTSVKEHERIKALHRYQILDTPPDGAFDRITALAAQLLNVPISITSLVDTDRIWFKSHHGVDIQEIDRVPGLCASVILNNAPYVLNDASIDPRSLANPLVAGEFGLRFYAGVPLTTHDNHNLGVLCVIDHKPRTITEQELSILSHLAQVVIDQMELRLASRHVHELSKQKSHLLAVLSHEIRTPLNGIMGMASLMQTTGLTEEQEEYTDIIETSADSLLTMLNHILDYSKMEAGKMELDRQPFDVRSCVTQVLELFTAESVKKGIGLHSEVDPQVPAALMGDKEKIKQILINLVGNAVKFTNEGTIGVYVNLTLIEHHRQDAHVTFTIKDTGIGIPQDQISRLFQTFSQLHSSYAGTGLGLSICKQLVELMNGRIWLEESTESGSTFSFDIRLPLAHDLH